MKQYEFTGKMLYYESLNCSYNGNPKYYGVFESDSGERLEGKTATDAACAYGFKDRPDNQRKIKYHITRAGNVIIDYIEILPHEGGTEK